MFLFAVLSHRFDKHVVMTAALVGAIITSICALFLPVGNTAALFIYMAVMSFFDSADNVTLDSMESDVVDADAVEAGERRAGLVSGAMSMISKIPEALGTGIVFIMLGWFGFDPSAAPEASNSETVRYMFVALPVALKLIIVFLLATYPLGKAKHAAIREEMALRS